MGRPQDPGPGHPWIQSVARLFLPSQKQPYQRPALRSWMDSKKWRSGAPKGRNRLARGNAPGGISKNVLSPEGAKLRQHWMVYLSCAWRDISRSLGRRPSAVFVPSGLGKLLERVPKALPWAILFCPFGAVRSTSAIHSIAHSIQLDLEHSRWGAGVSQVSKPAGPPSKSRR